MEHFYLSLLLLFISFMSLSLFFLFYKHRSPFTSPNLPPGKMGYPIIGESLEFLSTGRKGHPEKFIFDRIINYSSQVFKTSIFKEPTIFFCGASCNKFLFSNENKLVVSCWPEHLSKIIPIITLEINKESKKMKMLLPRFFKPDSLQRYIGVMDTLAQIHFASYWESKTQVTVYPLAKRYTFLVASRLFMSIEDETYIEKIVEPFNVLTSGVISMPIDLPGTPFNKAIKASNFIRKELLVIIRQRKVDLAEGKASSSQDLLSHMLTYNEEGKYMNEHDIASNILGILIAGHDPASAACTFLFKYLADLPHIYDTVYQEQMEISKSKSPGELLNWEDVNKMKYSWNVACEVMRLTPPIPGVFRKVINDFIFNGFSIPKGWKLYWSTHSTHKNPKYFPEPEKFDPRRFEGNGPPPYTFVPFGGGLRMCPGKEYARIEILVFMHHLVKRFKWEMLNPNEEIIVGPIPIPAKGFPIRLYPHKAT